MTVRPPATIRNARPEDFRSAIEAACHTEQQAADCIGVSLATVQRWKAGRAAMLECVLEWYKTSTEQKE
jgi:DNA-binding transcriptional regulator YiaG